MRGVLLIFLSAVIVYAGFDIPHFKVMHEGKEVVIKRQSLQNCDYPTSVDFVWNKKAKSECYKEFATFAGGLQPFIIDQKIQTIGEIEVLSFMKKAKKDANLLLVDARKDYWLSSGTIPSAVNISYDLLEYLELLHQSYINTMSRLGVLTNGKEHDFTQAKRLVVFCNGAWCPQSSWFIKNLIKIGYPKEKIKWYRGGMSAWKSFGLTTVKQD